MISVVEVLKRTEQYLRQREVPSPRLDSELLLGHVLGLQRMEVYLAHDRPMTDEELTALRPLVSRRGKREPLAWIVGQQSFHTLELLVSADVLVPRPDTETLVEAAITRPNLCMWPMLDVERALLGWRLQASYLGYGCMPSTNLQKPLHAPVIMCND